MLIQLGVSLRVPEPLDIRKAAERLSGYHVKMTLDRVIPLVLFNPNFHKGFVGCGRVVYVDVLRQPRSNSLYNVRVMVDVFDEDRLLKKASEAMKEQWNGDLPENANMADAVFEMLIGSSDMPSPDTLGFSIEDWTSIDPFKLRADWIQNPLMSLLLLRHDGHRALLLNGLCQILCKEGQGVEYFTSMNVYDPGIAIQLLEKHKVAVEWNEDRHQWLAIESNMAGDTLREASFRHAIAKTYGEDFLLENFN